LNDPIGAIVEAAHSGNVDTVIVNGEFKKRDKKMVGVDMKAFRRNVNEARNKLFERAGVSYAGDWVPESYEEKPE